MSEDSDRVALNFGDEGDESSQRKTTRQPVAVFFHLIFRILALVMYLICSSIMKGFVVSLVIIVLLVAIDFWTVKNITGRLLAGLRWWNYVDEEGKSHWVFESRKGANEQGAEVRIFWLSLVMTAVLWAVFAFVALVTIKLHWFMVSAVGLTLNGANLYGYVRCKMGSSKSITSSAKNFLGRQVLGSMISSMTSSTENKTSSGN